MDYIRRCHAADYAQNKPVKPYTCTMCGDICVVKRGETACFPKITGKISRGVGLINKIIKITESTEFFFFLCVLCGESYFLVVS